MPEKPTDPETLDEYLDEYLDADSDDVSDELRDAADLTEVPEADAAEQRRELLRLRDAPVPESAVERADPADAVEQAQVVDPGDEEYR